jgi:hypothetical protein
MGSLAAAYCLEQQGPQSHNFASEAFVTRFREHYDDQGRLNNLLPMPKRLGESR